MNKVTVVFDEKACWGCRACEVACKQEHNPFEYGAYSPKNPDSIRYLSVWGDGPKYVDGKLDFTWRINICKQCDDAPCIPSCPEGAIAVDEETGIVVHDKDKCTGCNAAAGISGKEKQETSPCKIGCPAGNNVQAYVSLAARGKYGEALEVIKQTSPFPSICGRICHHPCETECNRAQIDAPVNTHAIERFVADVDLKAEKRYLPEIKQKKNRKVAVIGSGPAGLTCAYYLAVGGYDVMIFEKESIPGGMLTMAIPAYRLPREVVEAEIDLLRTMGVVIKTGVEIGVDRTVADLRKEGFEAFFIGIGTQKCLRLGIEGEDLNGVYGGLDYLRASNRGETAALGNNVAVIGGGNTALDAVRSVRRQGSSNPFIVYRRGREEMPARPEELNECLEEAIPLLTLTQPVRFIGENGRIKAMECIKMRLAEPDESGRRKPEPIPGSEFQIPVDAVITALGQEADWACLTPECACTLSAWGTMKVHPVTMQTDDPDIFAGGDAVRGPQTVIEAIADGREAALSIGRYLEGNDMWLDRGRTLTAVTKPRKDVYDPASRTSMPSLDPASRVKSFEEVQQGFTEEMAVREGKRCITCGASCIQSCPYDALTFNVKTAKTQKCNLCIERVKHGLIPACADNVCLAHCVYFGEAGRIDEMIKERFWLKHRLEGTLGSLVIEVGEKEA